MYKYNVNKTVYNKFQGPDMTPKKYFTKQLLLWNKVFNTRKMPWKGEKDPYKIWLSEIILQQTRVEQGWDYYNRFVAAFPSLLPSWQKPPRKQKCLNYGKGWAIIPGVKT
jgi:hypothetical protein